jgi:phosphomannomutase
MPINTYSQGSLRSNLTYTPKELQFGTSGRRGIVSHLTHLEVFINVVAELKFLQSLPKIDGGIIAGESFFYAYDLRPSSSYYVKEQGNRGKLAQIIEHAIRHAGMIPVNYGQIPTPALTYCALMHGKGSIMVTGSHIPFDRNGYKTNTSQGELLKQHEQPINDNVEKIRSEFYGQSLADSLFTADGFLKLDPGQLSIEHSEAAQAYKQRYLDFFGHTALTGLRVLVYQHSAVGRDLVVEILRSVGAYVIPVGRSETFVPIDTENIHAEQLATIQALYDEAAAQYGNFDAIVSTDGDSDRPLILGIDPQTAAVHFFSGDLVGMVTADLLNPDAIVVPISSNDGIDHGTLKHLVEPKTRIGSPYVIAGMQKAIAAGKKTVCGWEANGGFLTGSDIICNGKRLSALPTRDAVLPILAVLSIAQRENIPLTTLFSRLPKRYSCAALLKQFPKTLGLAIVQHFSPENTIITNVEFIGNSCYCYDENNALIAIDMLENNALLAIQATLLNYFSNELGFVDITRINYIDGIRIYFTNYDIAHLRPSGNADELRIYAVADTQQRADAIANKAIQEPDGILRRLEHYVVDRGIQIPAL